MPLPKDGLIPWETGGELVWLEMHEEDSRTILYNPTVEEIEPLCRAHGIDFQEVMELIRTKRPDISGLLIHAPTVRDGYKEKQ